MCCYFTRKREFQIRCFPSNTNYLPKILNPKLFSVNCSKSICRLCYKTRQFQSAAIIEPPATHHFNGTNIVQYASSCHMIYSHTRTHATVGIQYGNLVFSWGMQEQLTRACQTSLVCIHTSRSAPTNIRAILLWTCSKSAESWAAETCFSVESKNFQKRSSCLPLHSLLLVPLKWLG